MLRCRNWHLNVGVNKNSPEQSKQRLQAQAFTVPSFTYGCAISAKTVRCVIVFPWIFAFLGDVPMCFLHVFIFLWLAFWYLRQPDSDVDTLLLNLLHCSFQPCIPNIAPGSGNITDDVDLDPSLAHSCQLALVLTLAGFGLQKGCGQTIPSNGAVKQVACS